MWSSRLVSLSFFFVDLSGACYTSPSDNKERKIDDKERKIDNRELKIDNKERKIDQESR
jgi:hypothetical protein